MTTLKMLYRRFQGWVHLLDVHFCVSTKFLGLLSLVAFTYVGVGLFVELFVR